MLLIAIVVGLLRKTMVW